MVFTPFESLVGGLLIGASVGAYGYFQGRISGISGIAGGVIRGCMNITHNSSATPQQQHFEWIQRVLYIAGLVSSGLFAFLLNLAPNNFMTLSHGVSLLSSPSTVGLFLLAGLLVGFGTQLGSGCTSGHMICGLARLSKRSFVSTMVFCGVTMMFVLGLGSADFVSRNIADNSVVADSFMQFPTLSHGLILLVLLSIVLLIYYVIVTNVRSFSDSTKHQVDLYLPFFNGFVFGLGLAISGMTSSMKVLGFFDFGGNNYDPSLVCVALGAIVPNLYIFNYFVVPSASRSENTCLCCKHHIPTSTVIDWKLIVGAALFGTGWGIVGVCPGPFFVNLGAINPIFLFYGIGFVGGVILKEKIIGA